MCGERREMSAPAGGRFCTGVDGESASEEADELALDGVGGLVLKQAFQGDSQACAGTATKLTLFSVRGVVARRSDSRLTCPILKGSAIRILAVLED